MINMNCEVLKNGLRDRFVDGLIIGSNVVRKLGDFALWYVRDLEHPAEKPVQASITYYGTKEAPLDGAPQAFTGTPDYTAQLRFHQQQLLQGLPEAMHQHHSNMVNKLGKEAA